jgi:hypothetical protein
VQEKVILAVPVASVLPNATPEGVFTVLGKLSVADADVQLGVAAVASGAQPIATIASNSQPKSRAQREALLKQCIMCHSL